MQQTIPEITIPYFLWDTKLRKVWGGGTKENYKAAAASMGRFLGRLETHQIQNGPTRWRSRNFAAGPQLLWMSHCETTQKVNVRSVQNITEKLNICLDSQKWKMQAGKRRRLLHHLKVSSNVFRRQIKAREEKLFRRNEEKWEEEETLRTNAVRISVSQQPTFQRKWTTFYLCNDGGGGRTVVLHICHGVSGVSSNDRVKQGSITVKSSRRFNPQFKKPTNR